MHEVFSLILDIHLKMNFVFCTSTIKLILKRQAQKEILRNLSMPKRRREAVQKAQRTKSTNDMNLFDKVLFSVRDISFARIL